MGGPSLTRLLGDTKRAMAVRHGEQDRLGQQRAEELNLLLVAGRTEPAPLAGEGQQVFMLAIIATDTGKPLFKGAFACGIEYSRGCAPADLCLLAEQTAVPQVPLPFTTLRRTPSAPHARPRRTSWHSPAAPDRGVSPCLPRHVAELWRGAGFRR